jgi:hypothetical protein
MHGVQLLLYQAHSSPPKGQAQKSHLKNKGIIFHANFLVVPPLLYVSMASKRATVSRGPLDSEAVVQQVLSYVGPGQWLICALGSKKWHELYAEVQSIEQRVQDDLGNWRSQRRTITARMTLYSAAALPQHHESNWLATVGCEFAQGAYTCSVQLPDMAMQRRY